MLKKLKSFLNLFSNKAQVKPQTELEKRINEAKKAVRYTSYDDITFVQNYNDVLSILQYKDTLGMALFVRDYIAGQAPTEVCVKYLLRS